jgi:hypothetical protein
MRNDKGKYPGMLIMFVMSALVVGVWSSNAQSQKSRAAVSAAPAVIQQPLYTEYKGVRLGMTAEQVRTKLGSPTFMDRELGYFVLSATETAQIGFDAAGKVKVISVDYQNGIGAPEPAAVVGGELETRENGTLYKVVYYESLGFQVSYGRTAGPVLIVSITIQKML